MRIYLLILMLGVQIAAHAGSACKQVAATPDQFESAVSLALETRAALNQENDRVVLLARVGTDLSRFDLTYSHVAFAVRTAEHTEWRVIHMLNHCGSDDSELYSQGLVNFYLDDLHRYEGLLIRIDPALQSRLLPLMQPAPAKALHEPRYNMIANWQSLRSQNSNQWILEMLVIAAHDGQPDRQHARRLLKQDGYQPDVVPIGRLERIFGGLTQANLNFGEHSLGTRLKGRYPIVSVRSIIRYLERTGAMVEQLKLELRQQAVFG